MNCNNYINQLFGLDGKIAMVTGAQGQLGKAICSGLRASGCLVIEADIVPTTTTLSCNSSNSPTTYYQIDISKADSCQQVFEAIKNEFGRLDILINNAGVSTFEPFEERPEDRFDWVMDINLKGTFLCIKNYVKLFDTKKQSKGSIINIGSIYGLISPDFRIYTDCARKNSEIYGATKAGIIQMTKYFAVHLAERNIRVNAVSPGGIYNPTNPQGEDFVRNYSYRCPMKRMANDSEMIGAILYLSGEGSNYTTGQNITIDGGMSCW